MRIAVDRSTASSPGSPDRASEQVPAASSPRRAPSIPASPREPPPGRAGAPPRGPYFGDIAVHPIQRKCATCTEEEAREDQRARVQRHAGGERRLPEVAPGVHEVLERPGASLHAGVRARMESAFGHDFSSIRVHDDPAAHAAARSIDAHAYTSGRHIVFGRGQYDPSTRPGQWLIAHELAHAVQQRQGTAVPARRAILGPAGGPLEREADAAADAAMAGRPARVEGLGGPMLQRFKACSHILDAAEQQRVAEKDVQAHLFGRISVLGDAEREFPIPAGSYTPYREEERQVIGGQAGTGGADIALMQGGVMELLEVKRGEWASVVDAETQVKNYVAKANQNLPFLDERWKQRGHPRVAVKSVTTMPTSRFKVESLVRLGGAPVSMAFCTDGVLAFKAIGAKDPGVYVCGSDPERTERFIDSVLGSAEVAVDSYIDGVVTPKLDKAIQSMALSAALAKLVKSPAFQRLINDYLGAAGAMLVEQLPIEALAKQLDDAMKGELDRLTRIIAKHIKDRVVGALRVHVKKGLKQWLQATLAALCAAAAAGASIIASELLRELKKSLGKILLDALPVVVEAVALQVAAEFMKALGETALDVLGKLAIAAGVVLAAILLWEVIAALAAGAAAAEIGAMISALLARLVPLLAI